MFLNAALSWDLFFFQGFIEPRTMRLICPLKIQIIVTAAYGGDASKVPSEINWSIVEFAFQQLEGGGAGHCKKMVVNVENFTNKVK